MFFQKLVKFSIFSIFILVPITALLTNFTEGDYLFLIFFIPFMGIFLSIVFIIFLSISRRCKVLVNSFTIKVKLDFPFPLNFLLKTEIEIPTSKIQYVRSNRLMDGNIWLSLHLSESFNMDELGFKKYLFNLSGMNIPRNDFAGFKHIIGLWNIFFLNKEGKSATYKDALYVENFIQDIIRLEEREVE